MSTSETVLTVLCAVLAVTTVVAGLVVPRRFPGFPRSVFVISLVSFGLVVGMLAAGVGDDGETAAATEPAVTRAPDTSASTAAQSTPGGAAEVEGDPAKGKEIFLGAGGCGGCHTLAEAGSTGNVGPNLDDAQPPYDVVVDVVTNGRGVMPAFGAQGILQAAQIQDVAAYVAQATSG